MNHLGTLLQRELRPTSDHARAIDLAERARRRAWTLFNELLEHGAKKPDGYAEPSQPDNELKQVIVMRTDLNMRKGKMIAQGAHAAMMFALNIILAQDKPSAEEFAWVTQGMKKIAVRCESENELLDIERRAKEARLTVHIVTDSGHTEFQGVPTRTCLAIGPNAPKDIDKITKNLKLL